ncbi:MAG TPA: DinB family protein [Thermoanaerobaculia bacterium]|nr:DinB family protein [Thermoanaerobaculia bacterium]
MPHLTLAERTAAIRELEESRLRLLAALEGLTEEQWRLRPTRDRWSIAECAEHITAAEVSMPKLVAAATGGERVEPAAERDEYVRRFTRDRSRREEAPERVRPKGRWPSLKETIQAFEERRAANLEFARTTREDLRSRFYPNPFVGVIDLYQWLLFLAAHTERHAVQIEEIRAWPASGKT